jgi:class 3 adenylate cyclase
LLNLDPTRCRACGAALPEGARFCPGCALAIEAGPGIDDRKLATVLFADLVGSTQLGDSQDPERTRALLERLFSAMSEEIERVGGTVEKFIGDAVMAAFGAPAALEDHAERALFAALALQHRMKEMFGDEVHLRVGVNTGEVVVGFALAGGSFATGDAVNVAARLEQAAAPDEILVGERTVGLAGAVFEFSDQLIVEAKGKPDGVICRRLVGVRAVSQPRLALGGRVAALIGRGPEFASLRDVFLEALNSGQPAMVTLAGEAGVRAGWPWSCVRGSKLKPACVPWREDAFRMAAGSPIGRWPRSSGSCLGSAKATMDRRSWSGWLDVRSSG